MHLVIGLLLGVVLAAAMSYATAPSQPGHEAVTVNQGQGDGSAGIEAAFAAIEGRDVRRLQILLDEGTDPNTKGHEGQTLLMEAAGRGFGEGVRLLLLSGARLDTRTDRGHTALMYAAMALSEEVVRILLEAGADPRARTQRGVTAFDIARDMLRHRLTMKVPFSRTHLDVLLPGHARHPVLDLLR